jgi:hypothetical protein
MTLLVRTITLVGVVASGIVSLAGYTHPAVNPVEQHPVRVAMPPEPVSSTRKADRLPEASAKPSTEGESQLALFDKRWDRMPTVAQIRVIPLDDRPAPPPPPLPVVRAERPSPEHEPDLEPKRRHRHEREHRHGDICERHGLHKVITRGGRSWRCR